MCIRDSSCNTALAASARTCRFQGGGHGVSCASRPRSTVPESADSRCRPAGASSTTVIVFTVTSRSVFSSVYRRAALVSCSCFRSLEFSTIVHSVITFFNCFPSPARDISVSQIIPPHSIVLPYSTRSRGLSNSLLFEPR